MKKALLTLLALLALFSLAACGGIGSGSALPLSEYQDPAGRYKLSIPEGWQADESRQRLTLTPPGYTSANPDHLRVVLYLVHAPQLDAAVQIDASKAELERFLAEYLDEEYKSVNEGETKVARYPAMLIDFGKPYNGGYLVGREVVVPLPVGAMVILGTGGEQAWEEFLPTFRKMLSSISFTGSFVPTPILP